LAERRPLPAAPRVETAALAPLSRFVIHVQAPIAALSSALSSRIPQRLAEARGVRLGLAGVLNYEVTRGSLSVSVSERGLVVQAPVRAHAEACSNARCYASCEPEALVRVEVPLKLRADYRFEEAQVSVSFTRGCKVRALGGLLTVDLTPTLKAQLLPELARVSKAIDRELPDVRAEVEKAWSELSVARALPLGGCMVLQPSGIVQGPMTPSAPSASEAIHARFALLARPELRTRCAEAPPATPLPPLQFDPALPEQGRVTLGLVMPLESLERAFETAGPLEVSKSRFRIAQASVASAGRKVEADLTLQGDTCGRVGLRANLDFSGDGLFIGLLQSELAVGEWARLAQSSLAVSPFVDALASAPRLVPSLSVVGIREALPALAASLSDRQTEVSAKVSSVRASGAIARGTNLVAWVEAHGSLFVKRK